MIGCPGAMTGSVNGVGMNAILSRADLQPAIVTQYIFGQPTLKKNCVLRLCKFLIGRSGVIMIVIPHKIAIPGLVSGLDSLMRRRLPEGVRRDRRGVGNSRGGQMPT